MIVCDTAYRDTEPTALKPDFGTSRSEFTLNFDEKSWYCGIAPEYFIRLQAREIDRIKIKYFRIISYHFISKGIIFMSV
jgi:hypothetical protein